MRILEEKEKKKKQQKIDADSGIWSLDVAKKRHRFDPFLAARIGMKYQPKKAADLGCGNGRYCAVFKAYGWSIVHGYEGTPNVMSLGIYDDIFQIDLSKRRWVEIDYDFVMCLEVGEHVPEKHEEFFLDTMTNFSSKDLIMSWAIPGQGGAGHLNEKPNEYIIGELAKRGFIHNEDESDELRKFSSLKWLRNTILKFEKENEELNYSGGNNV